MEEALLKEEICPESEFAEMMECLKQDLPAYFRISASRAESHKDAGEEVVIPKLLPWYPNNLAYQLNLTRREIRRQEVYFKLHNFLVAETESGAISRQEAVSMPCCLPWCLAWSPTTRCWTCAQLLAVRLGR